MSVFTDIKYTIIPVQAYNYAIRDRTESLVCIVTSNFFREEYTGKHSTVKNFFEKFVFSQHDLRTMMLPTFTPYLKTVMVFETPDGKKLLEISKDRTFWNKGHMRKIKYEMKDPEGNAFGSIITKAFLPPHLTLQDPVGYNFATGGSFFGWPILKDPSGRKLFKIKGKAWSPGTYKLEIFDKTIDPLYAIACAVVFAFDVRLRDPRRL